VSATLRDNADLALFQELGPDVKDAKACMRVLAANQLSGALRMVAMPKHNFCGGLCIRIRITISMGFHRVRDAFIWSAELSVVA
jgi:hypothetical protein